jgi:hypothetical protein
MSGWDVISSNFFTGMSSQEGTLNILFPLTSITAISGCVAFDIVNAHLKATIDIMDHHLCWSPLSYRIMYVYIGV